jgi:DNA-binding MurR/RpiR family transcriptional regulator
MASAIQHDVLPSSLSAAIAAARGSLTPAQQKVADYFGQAGPDTLVLSASQIADRLGVSDATVVRTAQALGYLGLPELRRALAEFADEPTLAERLHRTLERSEGVEGLLATSIDGLLASLDVLVQQIPPDLFGRTIDLLAGARPLLWSGIGPSAPLADYAATLCRRVGQPAAPLTQSGIGAADDLLLVEPGAVVVALAYGHVHPHVAALVNRAAHIKVPVILITDTLQGRLGTKVAETLITWRGTPGFFSSHAPTLLLLEALILGIAETEPTRAQRSLADLTDLRSQIS